MHALTDIHFSNMKEYVVLMTIKIDTAANMNIFPINVLSIIHIYPEVVTECLTSQEESKELAELKKENTNLRAALAAVQSK